MKKKLLKIVAVLAVLFVVTMVVVYFMLGSIIKKGVETVGPKLTKGDMTLGSASLSILGSGGIKNLEIGNPKNGDFTSPFAFKLGSASVKVKIGSIMSDKILIEEILIDGAEVCFEGLTGSNHKKILENIEAFTGSEDKEPADKKEDSKKKIEISFFKMTNTKVHLHLLGVTVPLSLPNFEKKDIGKENPKGADIKDVVASVYDGLYNSILGLVESSGEQISKLTGKTIDAIKDGASGVGDALKKGTDSVINIFSK